MKQSVVMLACLSAFLPTLSAQQRFEFSSGKNQHNTNIVVIAGQPQLKPYSIELKFELQPKGKEKKQNRKFTNDIFFELSELSELWIYGTGGLDGHYGFKSKSGEGREILAEWFPVALPSKYTIPAPVKAAKLILRYKGKAEADFKVELNGDFEIRYFNDRNENEYSYKISYSQSRSIKLSILKNGKPALLNPSSENRSSSSDILGQTLKVTIRDGF
jgi:hypothetical protein